MKQERQPTYWNTENGRKRRYFICKCGLQRYAWTQKHPCPNCSRKFEVKRKYAYELKPNTKERIIGLLTDLASDHGDFDEMLGIVREHFDGKDAGE